MIEIPAGTAGLVFDCDGTLVDSMPLHTLLWDECLLPFGVTLPKGFIDVHAGKPTDIILEIINVEHGVSINALDFLDAKEGRFRERLSEVGAIEPVVEVARRYRGVLPMAVVSGGCRLNVVGALEGIGALDWFDVILTADDPIKPKPAPDLFLTAAKMMGVAANKCHAFEDADAGIQAAVGAGMTVTDVRIVLASEAA
jgi:beta-phosphoglucomutase-like phosphatase (HAD superfamily)